MQENKKQNGTRNEGQRMPEYPRHTRSADPQQGMPEQQYMQPAELSDAQTEQAQAPVPTRKYKDTLFRMIFRDKTELLSLYNAINDTQHENPDELEITTLENAIYMNVKNDVSCLLDMRLNLYEHQSTVNPNIPLRNLFYVSKQLQKLVIKKDIYSSKQIPLPTPQFIVFYNGRDAQPERKLLRLSDAFQVKSGEINLELVVIQLNINPGFNEMLKQKCKALADYMRYVEKVRSYSNEMPLSEAVNRAIEECINEDILADFLRKNKAEVIYMSIFEYDEELHERTLLEEGIEIGQQRGIEIGQQRGIEIGQQRGIEIGQQRGIEHSVSMLLRLGHDTREIKSLLIREYGISDEDADELLKQGKS